MPRRYESNSEAVQQCVAEQEAWQEQTEILDCVPGVGPVTTAVGVAPMNYDSGKKRGYRKTKGGRGEVRSVLYMDTLVATRRNLVIRTQYQHLLKQSKEKKVALTACMRKFLTILNTMQHDQQPFCM